MRLYRIKVKPDKDTPKREADKSVTEDTARPVPTRTVDIDYSRLMPNASVLKV